MKPPVSSTDTEPSICLLPLAETSATVGAPGAALVPPRLMPPAPAGTAIGAGRGMAYAGGGHDAQPGGYPKIVILAGEAAGKVKRAAVKHRGGKLETLPDRTVVTDAVVPLKTVEIVEDAADRGSERVRRRKYQGAMRAARHQRRAPLPEGEAAVEIGDLHGARDRRARQIDFSRQISRAVRLVVNELFARGAPPCPRTGQCRSGSSGLTSARRRGRRR
jgi:hypothetical protein